MDIAKVGVVGCGTMGSGICQLVAGAGLDVVFVETSQQRVAAGLRRIGRRLDRGVAAGHLDSARRTAVHSRISGHTAYGALADVDLVIEAVPELLATKQGVFAALDAVLRPEAIVATNTSSLSVIDLAVVTSRPDRVLGLHFFNPAPVMALIELITTVITAPGVITAVEAFAAAVGKTPVVVRDRAGFVVNLLLFPYLNQAVGMLESGYAIREDIDTAMQLGTGHPIGPLALMDLIGLDSANSIMERMYEQFGDVRYAPKPLVRQLVAAGMLGRKSGRGFYTYAEPNSSKIVPEIVNDAPEVVPPDPAAIAGWTQVGVLGSGRMAAGIAQICALAGFDVVLRGRSVAKAEQALAGIAGSTQRAVDKGKMSAKDRAAALARMTATDHLGDFADCDAVIEAVAEDIEVKRALFATLSAVTKSTALLATTTSSLPVIACAMATSRPNRVVGMHFFNPAPVMRLVEVAATVRSEPMAVAQATALAARLGKQAVHCRDRAGFIVNALLFPYLNDAVRMLESGYATTQSIDTAMRLGCNHPMGPFELADIVGLDVTLQIIHSLHAEFRDHGFAPADLLGHLVAVGYLGRKSGRGFHVYN